MYNIVAMHMREMAVKKIMIYDYTKKSYNYYKVTVTCITYIYI